MDSMEKIKNNNYILHAGTAVILGPGVSPKVRMERANKYMKFEGNKGFYVKDDKVCINLLGEVYHLIGMPAGKEIVLAKANTPNTRFCFSTEEVCNKVSVNEMPMPNTDLHTRYEGGLLPQ